MYTRRLRRILSLIEKCIGGKCPIHVNDLFAANRGSNGRKLKMLVQPKFNIILNMGVTVLGIGAHPKFNIILNMGVTVLGIRALAYGTE